MLCHLLSCSRLPRLVFTKQVFEVFVEMVVDMSATSPVGPVELEDVFNCAKQFEYDQVCSKSAT